MSMSRSTTALVLVLCAATTRVAVADDGAARRSRRDDADTQTPVKRLVVIFQENVSFDHYFATYPRAANPAGEPRFTARPDTPSVNGLNDSLLAPNNPNSVQPFRLDRSQFETADQDHNYTDEQRAYDSGLMDQFVEKVGRGNGPNGERGGQVMGYYDGNTVTALWNYAQAFAMSDNSFSTNFGPSTPGALNLISGQTHGFARTSPAVTANGTVIGDPQPTGDSCNTRDNTTSADPANKNIGDLLNEKHVTSTANPNHLPPSSVAMIGRTDQANHQYDLADFWAVVDAGNLPSVSFLKAPAYQDGHAGYSDPLDEQEFLVSTINRLQRTQDWGDIAVVILYDDSDGWYDHVMGPIVNHSQDPANDALTPAGCGTRADPQHTLGAYQDRCGYGPRQPLLVISRFAKSNFVDHTVTDQSSVLRFIEDNWQTGRIDNFSFDTKAGSLLNMFSFKLR